ncbi:hypothetical protein RJJ37_29705 [Rhizobium redzepovicii]|uniref:Uncharacterized protein n=1 Tax=Rhizobium redzepovicii TaxID=2867518 RepID=A0AAW8PC38_9HYPH|nr:hypothetical protein [Rhizobium redzepovicii]MDR9763755.1 hypothetical protein [Rhizobium redzepovicii]
MLRTVLKTLEAQLHEQQMVLGSLRAVCLEQEREIAKKAEHVDSLKRVIDEMNVDNPSPGPSHPRPKKQKTPAHDAHNSVAHQIRKTASSILREAGRPMTQRAIKQKMDEIGFVIDNEKPVELIRIYLNRAKDEFRRVGDEGYIALD